MIHATAIVHPGARLGRDVEIGPYSIIGEHVAIGDGTRIGAHAVVSGHTRIGAGNHIFHMVSLGEAPQDKKYAGEPTRLEIGDCNTIREFCTFNTGTAQDEGITRIGDHNWIMAYVHIAHDCRVGNHTIFANNASLAGHVTVGDYAILGGFSTVHQFCRVGAHVITGLATSARQDIPPYLTATGNPAQPHGINSEGLKRRGFSAEAIAALKRAYRTLYRAGNSLAEAQRVLADEVAMHPELRLLADFIADPGRGIIR